MSQQQKPWYKKPLGMVAAVLLLPFFLIWYAWTKSNWSKNVKIGVTVASVGFIIIALAASPKTEQTAQKPAQNTPAVEQKKEEPAPVAFVFDVPSLLAKNVDEIRQTLGQPTDGALIEPTEKQKQLGTTKVWDNTFEKDSRSLLVTFNPTSREVIDFFISTDDPSGATKDKKKLLEVGNLKEGASNYSVEFVKALNNSSVYTGVKVTAK